MAISLKCHSPLRHYRSVVAFGCAMLLIATAACTRDTPPLPPVKQPPVEQPPVEQPPATAPVEPLMHEEAGDIGHGKWARVKAILYRNGGLTVETEQRNGNWGGGLRHTVLVTVRDAGGRLIGVSDVLRAPTRCSVPDWSCASLGTHNFMTKLPDAIGQHAASIDVLQADGASFVDLRGSFVQAIRGVKDVAEEVKNAIGQFYGAA